MIARLIRAQLADPLPGAASTLVAASLASPWLLDFNSSHAAVANHVAFAMALGPLALLITALRPAAAVSIAGGAWLIASPWLLGYGSTGIAGWLADLVIGAALIVISSEALFRGVLKRSDRSAGRSRPATGVQAGSHPSRRRVAGRRASSAAEAQQP